MSFFISFLSKSLLVSSSYIPHLDFGLLKALGHKIDVLKCCYNALLFACYFGVKGHDAGVP